MDSSPEKNLNLNRSSTASINPLKYNLVLTDKSRYLEISSLPCPSGTQNHIPGIKFDRIVKRESFLNSSADVHERRFELIKQPDIWTGTRRIRNIKIDQKGKDLKVENYNSMNYNPNYEVTMQKTAVLVPKFDLYNKNMDRTTFLNPCKELRPEGYQTEVAREKLSKIRTFSIQKQKNRDMKMYRQTEAYQNIQNDNERFEYIKKLMCA